MSLKSHVAPILCCFILISPFAIFNANAATVQDARSYVDTLTPTVVQVINDTSMADVQKQAKLQQLFVANVDIDWMAKFVMGRAWSQATPDQLQRYTQAYRDYLLAHYVTNFADYGGSKYKITDIKQDDEGFSVNMQVDTPQANQAVALGYHLHTDSANNMKISDIIVEGVSLITSQRSEYGAVVQQKGIDGLIAALQSKTQAEKKK